MADLKTLDDSELLAMLSERVAGDPEVERLLHEVEVRVLHYSAFAHRAGRLLLQLEELRLEAVKVTRLDVGE